MSGSRPSTITPAAAKATAQPLILPSSKQWYGKLGNFSGFGLDIGTPAQTVDLWPLTGARGIFTVDWSQCGGSNQACDNVQSFKFTTGNSSTWDKLGQFPAEILNSDNSATVATWGLDSVGLTQKDNTTVELEGHLVASFDAQYYTSGFLGLVPEATQLNGTYPSLLDSLWAEGKIPSRSWGYTAGASYRKNKVPGSLVLGGRDTGRYVPNNVTMKLNETTNLPKVSLRGFYVDGNPVAGIGTNPGNTYNLTIDSKRPFMNLPREIVQAIRELFPIEDETKSKTFKWNYDNQTRFNETKNTKITLELSAGPDSNETVSIDLPPGALKNPAKTPRVVEDCDLFPLESTNSKDYNLGRIFLAETYIAIDYDNQEFQLSEAIHTASNADNVVAIRPGQLVAAQSPNPRNSTSSAAAASSKPSHLAAKIIAPLVVFFIIAIAVGLFLRRIYTVKHQTLKTYFAELSGQTQQPQMQVVVHDTQNELPGDWAPVELPVAASIRSVSRKSDLSIQISRQPSSRGSVNVGTSEWI
ncbi:aspartic peptidase domain-containing protein [Geopyxis carbonaria]|nr:aspartic peptidase domain-containing protein [Geopyxis carbonaria]